MTRNHFSCLTALGACLTLWMPLHSQNQALLPRSEDSSTLDGIIKAHYEVVSGGAGVPRETANELLTQKD